MAEWQVVAEGVNIWDLGAVIADFELRKGDKLKVIMDLVVPVAPAFDLAGMEWIFQQAVPEEIIVRDVYGEGWNTAVVEMEADPPMWFLAFLGFLKAHWLLIMIGTMVLSAIIAAIIVLVKIAVAPALPVAAIAIGGSLALIGILAAISAKKREEVPVRT